jgi:hypothetical protein
LWFVHGDLGSDRDYQSTLHELRWPSAQRILIALGVVEPIPATLHTAMRGWVAYLDEMMVDRITNADTDIDTLVELATRPWSPPCTPPRCSTPRWPSHRPSSTHSTRSPPRHRYSRTPRRHGRWVGETAGDIVARLTDRS